MPESVNTPTLPLPGAVVGPYEGVFTHVVRSEDGSVHFRTTCSDDGVDKYATRMTTDLHDDFIRNADMHGMPYLTIAHYNQVARIGRATKLYRDGRRLKAEGVFWTADEDEFTRQLASAAASAALEESNLMPRLRKIRTSIGFTPLAAETEDLGVMAYTRGILPEIAMTTYPANSRMDFSAGRSDEEMATRALNPELMREDANNIVGEELAEELDKRLKAIHNDHQRAGEDTLTLLYRSAAQEVLEALPAHASARLSEQVWDATTILDRARKWAGQDTAGIVDLTRYMEFFAAQTKGDGTETGYRLPHHDVDDNDIVLSLPGLIAAGAMAGPEAQRHLEPHYAEAKRTAPWKRDSKNLEHRVEDVDDLRILHKSGIVGEEAITRAIDTLAEDIMSPSANMAIAALSELEFDAEKGFILRAGALDPVILPLSKVIAREGRKLQGRKLDELEKAIAALSELAEWAKKEEEAVGEGYDVRAVDPAVPFRAAMKERGGYEVEPNDGLIETLEQQEIREMIFKTAWTLIDIISANYDADDLTLEARLGNIEGAVNEFLSIVNSLMMMKHGGGRSKEADNKDDMDAQRNQPDVKPQGADKGTVNPNGVSAGKPDLTGFDQAVQQLRQVIVEGGDPSKVQEQLDQLVPAIESSLGEQDKPEANSEQYDALVGRVAGVEIGISTIMNRLDDLVDAMGEQPPAVRTEPTARPMVPRRRSYAAGPPPGGSDDDAPTTNRHGSRPLKISEAAALSMNRGRYP